MTTGRPDSLIDALFRAVASAGAEPTDGDLLGRFIARRDESAFAALVRRHGPMVLGVCRRLLSCEPDAEDAFQATFLILAHKAASVTPAEMVGNWLYGVARTTALKARRTNRRRAGHEHPVAGLPEPASVPRDDHWDDLALILDAELSRLPDRYRAVVVLCDLEGVSRREAARRLGLPEGTVNSRLSRARAILAKRLARHGVALPAGALVAVLSRNAAACVPTAVASSAVKVAFLTATGDAATAGAITANVAALTHGVGQTMLATKLKLVTAVALMFGLLGVTYALAVGGTKGTDPNDRRGPTASEKEQEKPAPPSPGKSGLPPEPPKTPGKDEALDSISGVVQEVGSDSILLPGDKRVLLTKNTKYLRGKGDDTTPAKLSDVTKGTRVSIGVTPRGAKLVASVVVIEWLQPSGAEKIKEPEDKRAGDPDAVMKAMDGFRKKLPEPQGEGEMNGLGVADIDGKTHPDSHLAGIASRLGVKTRAECIVLMTYLKDPDPKIRRIAAFAIEGVVKAYPTGMSSEDIQKVDSDGHRKLVKAFIAGIEKLPK